MGHVRVDAMVRAKRSARIRFLVDSRATQSLISPELAKDVGLVPSGVREAVRLATGRTVRLPTATGLVRIEDREASAIFWIGACDEPLLGVEALEALGLAIDPSRGRLRPTRPYASRLGGLGSGC